MPAHYDDSHIRDLGNQWINTGQRLHEYLGTMHGGVLSMAEGWTGKAGHAAQVVWNGVADHNIWHAIWEAGYVAQEVGKSIINYADELQKAIKEINRAHLIEALTTIFGMVLGIASFGIGGLLGRLAAMVGEIVESIASSISRIAAAAGAIGRAAAFTADSIINAATTLGTDILTQWMGSAAAGAPTKIDWAGEGVNIGLSVWMGWGMGGLDVFHAPNGLPGGSVPHVSAPTTPTPTPGQTNISVPNSSNLPHTGLPSVGDLSPFPLNSVVQTNHAPPTNSGVTNPVTGSPRPNAGIPGNTAPLPGTVRPAEGGPGRETPGMTRPTAPVPDTHVPNTSFGQGAGGGAQPPHLARDGATPTSGTPNAFLDGPPRTPGDLSGRPSSTPPAPHETGTGGRGVTVSGPDGRNNPPSTTTSHEGGVRETVPPSTVTSHAGGPEAAHVPGGGSSAGAGAGGGRGTATPAHTPGHTPEPTNGPATPGRSTTTPTPAHTPGHTPEPTNGPATPGRSTTTPTPAHTPGHTPEGSSSPATPSRSGADVRSSAPGSTGGARTTHDVPQTSHPATTGGGGGGRRPVDSHGGHAKPDGTTVHTKPDGTTVHAETSATTEVHAGGGRPADSLSSPASEAPGIRQHDIGSGATAHDGSPEGVLTGGTGHDAGTVPGHQPTHTPTPGDPAKTEQWNTFKQEQNARNLPVVEAEARLEYRQQDLDTAWQNAYDKFAENDLFGGSHLARDGREALNARWQWRNSITREFRAEVDRTGHISSDAFTRIVDGAQKNAYKYLVRADQSERFTARFKEQVDAYKANRFGEGEDLPQFDRAPSKYAFDRDLQTYVKDDTTVYGHPDADIQGPVAKLKDGADGSRPDDFTFVEHTSDTNAPVDHFRDKSHDFNALEQYYIGKKEEFNQILDRFVHDGDSGGGLPSHTGRQIDGLLDGVFDDLGGMATREHDIRVATGEKFDDLIRWNSRGAEELPDSFVNQVRLDFQRDLRADHALVFRRGDGDGPRELWDWATNRAIDGLPSRIAKEHFIRGRLSEETQHVQEHLSGLGEDFLGHFGEAGRQRVVGEYLDTVRTTAGQHFNERWGDVPKAGESGPTWTDMRDHLRSSLPGRITHEGDLQAVVGDSAHAFHESLGHPDSIESFQLHNDTVSRLGNDFRTERVVKYDELFAPDGHKSQAWLAHDSRHGDPFQSRLGDLRAGDYNSDFHSTYYPAFRDWRAGTPSPGESVPVRTGSDGHPATTNPAGTGRPPATTNPADTGAPAVPPREHTGDQQQVTVVPAAGTHQGPGPSGVETQADHTPPHQDQSQVQLTAERDMVGSPGVTSHRPDTTLSTHTSATTLHSGKQDQRAPQVSRQADSGTASLPSEVNRWLQRNTDHTFTRAQIDQAHQDLLHERPSLADLPVQTQAVLIGNSLARPMDQTVRAATDLLMRYTGVYPDSQRIHRVHQQLFEQFGSEFQQLTPGRQAEVVVARMLDLRAGLHDVKHDVKAVHPEPEELVPPSSPVEHSELLEPPASTQSPGTVTAPIDRNAHDGVRNEAVSETPSVPHEAVQDQDVAQPGSRSGSLADTEDVDVLGAPATRTVDKGKGRDRGPAIVSESERTEFIQGSSSGLLHEPDNEHVPFEQAMRELQVKNESLRGLTLDEVREAFHIQRYADPSLPGLRQQERLRDLAQIGWELHAHGPAAARTLAARLAEHAIRPGAFGGAVEETSASSATQSGSQANASQESPVPAHLVPEALLNTDPKTFLRANVLSMDMDKGLEIHAAGLNAVDRDQFLKSLDVLPGREGHLPEHRFVLVRRGLDTTGKPVFALAPAVEWYVERYGAERFRFQEGTTLPGVRTDGYVDAAYVPYLTRSAQDYANQVGHTDVLREPGQSGPRLVVTPTMNGCAYAVTPHADPARMRVWHYQSPDSKMPYPVQFRRDQQPTDWYGAGEYAGAVPQGSLFEVANLMWYGKDGWEFVSQENHTGTKDRGAVTLANVLGRRVDLESGHEVTHTAAAYQSLVHSELHDWDLPQAMRNIEGVAPAGPDTVVLRQVYSRIEQHISGEIAELGRAQNPDELRALADTFKAGRTALMSDLERLIAEAGAQSASWATTNATQGAVKTRRDLAEQMVDQFVNRPAKDWIDLLRDESAPQHPKTMAAVHQTKARMELGNTGSTVNVVFENILRAKPKGPVERAVHAVMEQVRNEIKTEIAQLGRVDDLDGLKSLAVKLRQQRETVRIVAEAGYHAMTRDERDRKQVGQFHQQVKELLDGLVTPRLENWIDGLRQETTALAAGSSWYRLPQTEQRELGRTVQDLLPAGSRDDGFFDLRVQRAYDGLDLAILAQPLPQQAARVADLLYGGARITEVDDFFVRSVNSVLKDRSKAPVSPWQVHQAYQRLASSRGVTFTRSNSVYRQEAIAQYLAGLVRNAVPGGAPSVHIEPQDAPVHEVSVDNSLSGGDLTEGLRERLNRPELLNAVHEGVRVRDRGLTDGQRAGFVRPQEDLRLAYGWLDKVNPYRAQGGGFETNCVLTAIAVDLTLRDGAVHQASPSELGGDHQITQDTSGLHNYLSNYLDRTPDPVSGSAAVMTAMSAAPLGARGMLVIEDLTGGIGHVVNVTHDHNGVVFLDGQSGIPVHEPAGAVSFLPTTEGIPGHPLHPQTDTTTTTTTPPRTLGAPKRLAAIPELDETSVPVLPPVQEPVQRSGRVTTTAVDLDEQRPPRLDLELPAALLTTGPVRFDDGTQLPLYMTGGIGSQLPGLPQDVVRRSFAFGQSNHTLRGIDHVERELGIRLDQSAGSRPAVVKGSREQDGFGLLAQVSRSLRDSPQEFFGDGKQFVYKAADGKTRTLEVTARPYGNWERFTSGYGNPVKIDTMQRSTATGGQIKVNGTSFGLAPTAPLGPLKQLVSPFARLNLQANFGKQVRYNQQTQVVNQTETRTTDGSRVHLDDVWFEFSVKDRHGDPIDLSGRPIPQGAVTTRRPVEFGFAVRDGLTVRIADSLTTGKALTDSLPPRMRLNSNSHFRMVNTEAYGPMSHIREWVREQAGVESGSMAAAQIGDFFSTGGFHGMSRVLNSGPVVTPPLFGGKHGSDPLGVFSVKAESGDAVLINETAAAELRDIAQSTARNERQIGKSHGVDIGASVGPAVQLFGLENGAFDLRLMAGLTGRYGASRSRSTLSGGSAAVKVAAQAKGAKTGLYLVQKTVTVTAPPNTKKAPPKSTHSASGHSGRLQKNSPRNWSEPPRSQTFQTWAVERLTRSEARRLAGLDKNKQVGKEPVAPPYLSQDQPSTLGMSRPEEFTFADGNVSRDIDGKRVTFPEHFADAVLKEVGKVYPDLVAPLRELDPHNPRWRDDSHFQTVLHNTLEVLNQLSHHSMASNVETMMTTGLRIDLVESGALSRGHRYVWVDAKLTGRRYEGKQDDLRLRYSAPGSETVGGQQSGSRTVQGGLEALVSLRDTNSNGIGRPEQLGTASVGARLGRRTESESGYGVAATHEAMSIGTGGSHLYSYQISLGAQRGGYWRFRRWMRGLMFMNVLGTQPFVFREQESTLIAPPTTTSGQDTPGLGRVLLSLPVEHTPVTTPATPAGQAVQQTPPETLSREDARDLALGTGKTLQGTPARTPAVLAAHPHQTISVTADERLTGVVEDVLKEASGGSWTVTQKGAPAHDAAVQLTESRQLRANFDQSSTETGWRAPELFASAPYLNRSTSLAHRTTILPGMTALTKAEKVETETTVGGVTQAAGREARTNTLFFGGQVGYQKSHNAGSGVTGTYALVASPYRLDVSKSVTVQRAAVSEVNRKDTGRHVLATAPVQHEIAAASERIGAWAHTKDHVPASLAGVSGRKLVVPDGWVGHVPEKSAYRLGLLKDGFGDVPLYNKQSWSPFPWLSGHAFGSWPVNSLDTAAALRQFEEQLTPLGLSAQDREQMRRLVSGRVVRAIGKEMSGTGSAVPARIGRWGSDWAQTWVGHRQVRLRAQLVPVKGTDDSFEGLGHSVELEEHRQAVESIQQAHSRASGKLIGVSVSEGAHTSDSVARSAGPTLSQVGSSVQATTQTRNASSVEFSTATTTQAHGEYATEYELRLDLEITDTKPADPAAVAHSGMGRLKDEAGRWLQMWTGRRKHSISVQANVGRLIEHFPLSLMRPDPQNAAGLVDPLEPARLAQHGEPHRVALPSSLGAGGWHDVAHLDSGGTVKPFEMPEDGFAIRSVVGLDGLHTANTLALGAAYNASLSVPEHGPLDADLLVKAKDTALTRAGTGSAQSLEDGTSNAALTAFYDRTLTPDGYQVAGLTDRGFFGGADGALALYSKPDLSGARLMAVADGMKFEGAERGTHGVGSSAGRVGAADHVLFAGPTTSSPAVGTSQIGSGSGAQEVDSVTAGQASEQLASVNVKPDKGRAFLFAIPTKWLSIAQVHHHLKDSAPVGRVRSLFGNPQREPQALETDTTVLAWVREDRARQLGLVGDANFPAKVAESWDAVSKADKEWTAADRAYWDLRRGDAAKRESELIATDKVLNDLTGGGQRSVPSVEDALGALRSLEQDNDFAEPAHDGWEEIRSEQIEQARTTLARARQVAAARAARDTAQQRLNDVESALNARLAFADALSDEYTRVRRLTDRLTNWYQLDATTQGRGPIENIPEPPKAVFSRPPKADAAKAEALKKGKEADRTGIAGMTRQLGAAGTAGFVRPQEDLRLAYGWLDKVNPYRAQGGGFETNCVLTAIAVDLSLRDGAVHQASPSELGGDRQVTQDTSGLRNFLSNYLDRTPDPVSGSAAVVTAMSAAPLGARGMLVIEDTAGGIGHVVNVAHDHNGVVFLDGQSGIPVHEPAGVVSFLPTTEGIPGHPLHPQTDTITTTTTPSRTLGGPENATDKASTVDGVSSGRPHVKARAARRKPVDPVERQRFDRFSRELERLVVRPNPDREQLGRAIGEFLGDVSSEHRHTWVREVRQLIDTLPDGKYLDESVNAAHKALDGHDHDWPVLGVPGAEYIAASQVADGPGQGFINRDVPETVVIDGEPYVPVYSAVFGDALGSHAPRFKDIGQDEDGVVQIHTGSEGVDEKVLWVSFGQPLRQVKWVEKYRADHAQEPMIRSFLVPLRTVSEISRNAVTEHHSSSNTRDLNVDKHFASNQFGIREAGSLELLRQTALPGSLRSYTDGDIEQRPGSWGEVRPLHELRDRLGVPDETMPGFEVFTEGTGFLSPAKYESTARTLREVVAAHYGNSSLREPGDRVLSRGDVERFFDEHAPARLKENIASKADKRAAVEVFVRDHLIPWANQARITQALHHEYDEFLESGPSTTPVAYRLTESVPVLRGQRRTFAHRLGAEHRRHMEVRFGIRQGYEELGNLITGAFKSAPPQVRRELNQLKDQRAEILADYQFKIGDRLTLPDRNDAYRSTALDAHQRITTALHGTAPDATVQQILDVLTRIRTTTETQPQNTSAPRKLGATGAAATMRPQEDLRLAYEWLDKVNPYRAQGDGFDTNCVLTAIAVDLSLRDGAVHQASPSELGGDRQITQDTSGLHNYLENYLDRTPDPVTGSAAVVTAMSAAPLGARGMLVIENTTGGIGHVVNVTHDHNGVVFLDGQSGIPVHQPAGAVSFLPTTEGIPGHPLHPQTNTTTTTPPRTLGTPAAQTSHAEGVEVDLSGFTERVGSGVTRVAEQHSEPQDDVSLDDRYGPAVQPKTVKRGEKDDALPPQVRLNPLWYSLEDFKPALLERGGVWTYAIDEDGRFFIGSEDVWSIAGEEERTELLEAMRTTHPDLTMADLKGLLNDQGVPTVAAGFDQTGATVIGSARVGGELFRDPLTGQWTIDASSRYVGPVVRPGVEPATVTRWVRNAAETLSSALRMTILAKDAERPTITHGALVAGTGTGELDRDYGPLAGPKKVKDRERDGVALDQVRLNPLWYRLEDFKPALLERTEGVWHYAVDEDGQISIGSDQVLSIMTQEELHELLSHMRRADPDLTLEQLKAAIDNQGHPTVAAGFREDGTTAVRPARVSGELSYNPASQAWELTDKSGRYMSNKIRPSVDSDEARQWLANTAGRISEHLGVPVKPVLFKNAPGTATSAPDGVLAGSSPRTERSEVMTEYAGAAQELAAAFTAGAAFRERLQGAGSSADAEVADTHERRLAAAESRFEAAEGRMVELGLGDLSGRDDALLPDEMRELPAREFRAAMGRAEELLGAPAVVFGSERHVREMRDAHRVAQIAVAAELVQGREEAARTVAAEFSELLGTQPGKRLGGALIVAGVNLTEQFRKATEELEEEHESNLRMLRQHLEWTTRQAAAAKSLSVVDTLWGWLGWSSPQPAGPKWDDESESELRDSIAKLPDEMLLKQKKFLADQISAIERGLQEERHGQVLSAAERRAFRHDRDRIRKRLARLIVEPTGHRGYHAVLETEVGKHPQFGAKRQDVRVDNYTDLARGLLGWTAAKPSRHQEKELALRVESEGHVEQMLDILLTRIHTHVRDLPDGERMLGEMESGVSHADGRELGAYLRHFRAKNLPEDLRHLATTVWDRGGMAAVLRDPAEFGIRDKMMVLHDLMEYFKDSRHYPVTYGTGLLPADRSKEAQSTTVVDEDGRRIHSTKDRGQNPLKDGRTHPSTRNENAESTILARELGIPVWAGQSFTAMRMFKLAQWAGASRQEIAAVAWGIFAFWRLHYDHREELAHHTLHETLDIAQNFGVPYSLRDRAAGLSEVTVEHLLTYVETEAAGFARLAERVNRAVDALSRREVPESMNETLGELGDAAAYLTAVALEIERRMGPARSLVGEGLTKPGIHAVIELVDHVPAGLAAQEVVTEHGRVLLLGLDGGSRDHGMDPQAEGWEMGREITVMAERYGLQERELEQPFTVPGSGKGAEVFREFSRPFPHSSRSYGYQVGSAGSVLLPDGGALRGRWTRFGDDFLHEQGYVLRGDNGWIGRVANWEELRTVLPSDAAEYELAADEARMYFVPSDGGGRTVVLPLTEERTESDGGRTGVGLRATAAGAYEPSVEGDRTDLVADAVSPSDTGARFAVEVDAVDAVHADRTAHPVDEVDAVDLLDLDRFRAHTSDSTASDLRSLSRVADLDRLLHDYQAIDEHDHARRADALDELSERARAYAATTKNEFRQQAVQRLVEQAGTRAAMYRRQEGSQEAPAGTAEAVPPGPLGYRERIALAKREWEGPVTEEVARLEQMLLDAGPGARSLVMGAVPGEQLWAVNVLGTVRWLEQATAERTQAPQSAQGTVVSIDLDPRARLIAPDPRLLGAGAGTEAARFCELVVGGDLKHVV